MQWSACRPTSSREHARAAVVEQDRRGTPAARRPRSRRSRARCTGSSARPSRSAAGAAGRPRGRRSAAASFSIPSDGDQHRRQRRAHAPVALRLDDDDGAGLGDAEVRAAHAHLRAQELLAQVDARRLGELARVVARSTRRRSSGGRGRGSRCGCGGSPGTRMCDDLSPSSCRISSAKSVSIAWTPPAASASLRPISSVVSDLTLTDLGGAVRAARSPSDDRRSPPPRRAPSAPARRPPATAASNWSEVLVEALADVCCLIARPASRSSSQSGTSATTRGALVADRRASRCAGWRAAGSSAERLARRPAGTRFALTRRPSARISARCSVPHAGALAREPAADLHQARVVDGGARPPPRSTTSARHLSASIARRRVRVLDRERAAEAAALARAPAARRARGPRTARSSRSGASPTFGHAQRMAGRVVGDAVREDAPTSVDAEPVDEQLRELEHRRRLAAELRIELAHHPDARRRRRDDRVVAARRRRTKRAREPLRLVAVAAVRRGAGRSTSAPPGTRPRGRAARAAARRPSPSPGRACRRSR